MTSLRDQLLKLKEGGIYPDFAYRHFDTLIDVALGLEAENAVMRDALAFYAMQQHVDNLGTRVEKPKEIGGAGSYEQAFVSRFFYEDGSIARAALDVPRQALASAAEKLRNL